MLKESLKEKHTDGQETIMIDDSSITLKLTAELIEEDCEIDFECMLSELLESDEIREFCVEMIKHNIAEGVHKELAVEEKAKSILIETIVRLIEAD